MPFLRGSLSFERFRVLNFSQRLLDDSHLDIMRGHVAGKAQTDSEDNTHVGFLGGAHLFDQEFDFEKNVINEAVHAGIRIDTNQVPAAIRNAWLQVELAGMIKDAPNGKLTKTMRQEAKESIEERCRAEAATGKYRKMSSAPWLWDLQREQLLFGGSGPAGIHCADLLERAFEIETRRVTAGSIAQLWAEQNSRFEELDDVLPATFVPLHGVPRLPWTNEYSSAPDFLGNEYILWLWWWLDSQADSISLGEDGEVTAMLTKTLTLECPLGEAGKETITAEAPVHLPEALLAVRSGKLPRRTGMSLARDGMRFDLVLQAETFAVSGAKITTDDEERMEDFDRINAIRHMVDTIDGMFHAFLERRVTEQWESDLEGIRNWLESTSQRGQIAA